MKLILIVLVIFTFSFLPSAAAKKKNKNKYKYEYKVVKVTNGGSISGKAIFKGETVPEDEVLTLTSEQDLCGNTLPARKYIINDNREIKNAVVYLADIKAGKEIPSAPVIIDNILCAFEPHMSIGYKGNMVINRNSDPVLHGIHTFINGKFAYNLAIPDNSNEIKRKLRKVGLMTIKCNPHPWMIGYAYIFAHPYAAVTNEKGEFSINDIPAGYYEVKAWHESFGEISLGNVTVTAGRETKIKADFK